MTILTTPSRPTAAVEQSEAWRPRSDADLLTAQLRALDTWHRLITAAAPPVPGQSRESRLDAARHRDVVQRERDALIAWADGVLRRDFLFGQAATPRAVIGHRHEWLRAKLTAAFRDDGVDVIASTDDGAQVAAVVVMEQPDIVFVEDLLPSLSGLELVTRTRILAPAAVIGAHALGQPGMAPLLDAGVRAVFSRRIPPAEIAAELVACLHGRQAALTLV
jgi:CheY-like chemotaxis protein